MIIFLQEFKVGWFMWKPCKYLYKVHKSTKPVKTTEEVSLIK